MSRYFKMGDDALFYQLQAADSIQWINRAGIDFKPGTRALDLGCGWGVFGDALAKRGCTVTFADQKNSLVPGCDNSGSFIRVDLDNSALSEFKNFDLVICSNVLEHLAKPYTLLNLLPNVLAPGGVVYLSWTNWLSPFGGHDFAPLHYIGARPGFWLWSLLTGKRPYHVPYVRLFPLHIGRLLKRLRRIPALSILKMAPRYYPELPFILKVPVLREFLTWNCAILLRKNPGLA